MMIGYGDEDARPGGAGCAIILVVLMLIGLVLWWLLWWLL
jgi:hypothetical protein